MLPFLRVTRTLRMHVDLVQNAGTTARSIQYLLFREWVGEVGRMVSGTNEPDENFTRAATFHRLALWGISLVVNEPLSPPSPTDGFLGNIFIGIAGMIGAGKSTLAKALGEHMGIDTYYEPVADNEYLADFYKDTARYSFAMQVYLLNRRFQQHQEIIWRGRSAVQDRTIYEDSIFARMLADTGLMDPRDFRTYTQLFRHMSNFMCKPSVIVYLDVSPERSMERILQRSRDVENQIETDYLVALYKGYTAFMTDIAKVIPVIRVDYERFATAEEMAEMIKREYLHHSFLREVTRFDPTRG